MARASVRKNFHFAQTDARFVNHLDKERLTKTIGNVVNFLDCASSLVDCDSVVVAGTSWHLSIRTSVKRGQTYMQCFLCGAGNGVWHRWVVLGTDGVRSPHDIVDNTSVTITVDFAVGMDVFSEEYSLSDVIFIVQERALFANKGYLAVMSPVFAKMFLNEFKEATADTVTFKDTKFEDFLTFLSLIYPLRETLSDANVLSAYRLFHFYQVDFMLEEAETFLQRTACCVPLIEKLLLAQELDREVLCDRLVASMSVQDVKTIAEHDKKHQLSSESMAKILEKYIELKP